MGFENVYLRAPHIVQSTICHDVFDALYGSETQQPEDDAVMPATSTSHPKLPCNRVSPYQGLGPRFEPQVLALGRTADGWTFFGDMRQQLRLYFGQQGGRRSPTVSVTASFFRCS